jgi:hypothetical protein
MNTWRRSYDRRSFFLGAIMSFESLGDGAVKHAFSEADIVSFPLLLSEELVDIGTRLREQHAALLHASCAQTGVPAVDAAYMVAKARSEAIDPNRIYIHIQTIDGSIDVLRRSLRVAFEVKGETPAAREKNTTDEVKAKIEKIINRLTAVRRKNLAIDIVNMHEPQPVVSAETQPDANPRGFGDPDGGATHPTQEPKGFPDRA